MKNRLWYNEKEEYIFSRAWAPRRKDESGINAKTMILRVFLRYSPYFLRLHYLHGVIYVIYSTETACENYLIVVIVLMCKFDGYIS